MCLDQFDDFKIEDATVWIDPLDGTKDFIKGNRSSVTVLIGLCLKDCSRFGIVHSPYFLEKEKIGRTFFGSAEHGMFYFDYNPEMGVQELLKR